MPSIAGQPARLDDRQFELAVRKLADALRYGSDASPYLGSGIDYAQSRPYVSGDPVKSIDWRVTARIGRHFVKQYEAPKQLPTWLIIDDTGSMAPAAGPTARNPGKWAWAVLLAGALGLAALRRTSPVGFVTTNRGVETPSLSRGRLHSRLHDLRRCIPVGAASLGEALREAGGAMSERGNLIILSDWHDPALLETVRTAAERHDVVALRLTDPAELRPLEGGVVGVLRASEAETGQEFFATGHSRFGGAVDVEAELSRAAVDHISLRTDMAFVPLLVEFLRRRGNLTGRRR